MIEARTRRVESPLEKPGLQPPQAMILHAIKNPFAVGAVAAASPQLVSDMVAEVDARRDLVVELGAGTGVITRALLESRRYRRGLVSIEIDPRLAEIARNGRAEGAEVIVADALDLDYLFHAGRVDSIVCSLPLTLFSGARLDRLFEAARAVMSDDAAFVFYLYRMGLWTRRYQKVMARARRHFPTVIERPTVWRNLPPARVIVCRQ